MNHFEIFGFQMNDFEPAFDDDRVVGPSSVDVAEWSGADRERDADSWEVCSILVVDAVFFVVFGIGSMVSFTRLVVFVSDRWRPLSWVFWTDGSACLNENEISRRYHLKTRKINLLFTRIIHNRRSFVCFPRSKSSRWGRFFRRVRFWNIGGCWKLCTVFWRDIASR